MIIRVSLLAAIVASLTFSPIPAYNHLKLVSASDVDVASVQPIELASAADSLRSTSSFYSFRRDVRRCAAPRCGGYFIRLVNQSRTRCADNRFQRECYVASIEWGGQTQPNDPGLLRGSMRLHRRSLFGVFRVSEVWQAASANQPTGTFYRVRDRGVRCITHPCETHHEATLNSTASRNIAGVDLAGAGAAENLLSDATAAMNSPDGILVSGFHAPVSGPGGRSRTLKATQFYLRAKSAVNVGGGDRNRTDE